MGSNFKRNGEVMGPTPWMDWMRSYIGQAEITGQPPTDFDRMVFSHTDFGGLGDTMESGCAATACAALELTGYTSPHSAAALSFQNYGTACPLQPGCIAVFDFGGGDHHVSFCDTINDDGTGTFLGGNQSHYLKESIFDLDYVIATRWPVKAN